jgi:outer membrane immunogenic protein
MLRGGLSASVAVSALIGGAAVAQTPPMNWTGFYVGANAGYFSGTSTVTDVDGLYGPNGRNYTVNPSGFIGGGQGGYNWQWDRLVLGVEGDFDGSSASDSTTQLGMTQKSDISMLATIRGRIGWALPNAPLLIYGTGGIAFGDVNDSVTGIGTVRSDKWRTGWTAGGGGEWAFDRNWSLKVEALYVDLGSAAALSVGAPGNYRFRFKDNGWLGRAGINFHF